MQYRKSNKSSGFTLIEMMVVIAIAGILLAYAIPSYREFGLRQKVTNVTNGLLSDLMYARATAIKQGQSVIVTSVSGGNEWNAGWTISLVSDNVLLRQSDAVNRAVKLKGGGASIVFNNFGAASTINTITVSHPDVSKSVIIDVLASGMVFSREPPP